MAGMQQEHIQQMAHIQADIESLRRDVGRMPPRGVQGPPPFQPPPVPPPQSLHPNRQPIGRPEPAVMIGAQESMRPPSPTGNRHVMEPLDALGPAPYDPVAGFVIFYDFILGLDPTFQKVRLLSGLYSNGHRMGHSSSLPDVLCETWNSPQHVANVPRGNLAMLSAKQPIPRVRPGSSITLVMELQAAGGFNPYGQEVQHLSSCGWTKLDLFDPHNQVLSGRWKLPVRGLPLRPGLNTGQLNTVPQVGKAELYLRIINARDADLQSMAEIDPRNFSLYQYPPLTPSPGATTTDNPAPMPSFQQPPNSFQLSLSPYTDYVDPPPVQEMPSQQRANQRGDMRDEDELGDAGGSEDRVGFIMDGVTDAPLGDGTLRLVGYHMSTGQVIRTRGKGMSCIISAVSSNVLHGCFVFGEQEAVFGKVSPEEDMLLVLRFYHWPGGSTAWAPWQQRRRFQPLLASEEWMAAWGALRLTRREMGADSADGGHLVWNTGIHDLPLYHSPAPPVINLSATQPEEYEEIFERYGSARVQLCVFSKTRPDFPFPPEPPVLNEDSTMVPEGAYISHSRRKPMLDPFSSTDGIAVFIDGARFLPDSATLTRVTGRIFDKNYDQIGPDISTGIDLNSDIFHPHYNYSLQINSPNVPPTSTLLLKVYTLDRFSRELALIGWAALNLFVECGKQRAPSSDSSGVQVSLNEGGHQIRIYHSPPPTDRSFSVESLASSGRIVPCATLLTRIRKGKIEHRAEDGTAHEERPQYSQKVYYSDTAQPSPGEVRLYKAMLSRSLVRVREVIPPLAGSFGQEMTPDLQLSDWLQRTFNEKMKNSAPRPFPLCCVSRYLVTSGMSVSVDSAQNLPWSGMTAAHFCFNPPAALYYGDPWRKYDRALPVHDMDLDGSQNCPVWRDGFQTFTGRMFSKYLTLIIHLHEIQPQEVGGHRTEQAGQQGSAMEERSQEFIAGSQAWTAMRVFYKSYCNLGAFQLPLYQGAPSLAVLHALRSEDCRAKLKHLEQNKLISRVAAASVIVRIADGRRREEMERFGSQDINQMYLPEEAIDTYAPQPSGRKLSELAPPGQEEFRKRLGNWYRKYLRAYYRPPQETAKDAAANSEDKGELHLS